MSGTFDPQTVSDKKLKSMRLNAKIFSVVLLFELLDLVVATALGASILFLLALVGAFAVPYAYALTMTLRRLKAVDEVRSRIPLVWPPKALQCPVCSAIDELDYRDEALFTDFFGHRAHELCAAWVWKGWRPPTKQLPGDIPVQHRYEIDCRCDACRGLK